MKYLLIIAIMLVSYSASAACNGDCKCGGVKAMTAKESATESAKAVGETAAYFFGGAKLVASGLHPAAIVIPGLCIYLSRDQRAYNLANGIHHSREKRNRWRSAR